MPRISVLIPTTGSPEKAIRTICNLSGTAVHPESVEYIIILDSDSPAFGTFLSATHTLLGAGFGVKVICGGSRGYENLHELYSDGCLASTAEFIWIANDDIRVETFGWDDKYCEALRNLSFAVASAAINEDPVETGGSPGNYRWAFPFFHRSLFTAVGSVSLGNTNVDRTLEAYALVSGKYTHASVSIRHAREFLIPGSSREKVYRDAEQNWGACQAEWSRLGALMELRVQHWYATQAGARLIEGQ